jgi:hypothetical protein
MHMLIYRYGSKLTTVGWNLRFLSCLVVEHRIVKYPIVTVHIDAVFHKLYKN